MFQFHWLDSLKNRIAKKTSRLTRTRRAMLGAAGLRAREARRLNAAELLEDRALLSTITVTTLNNATTNDGLVSLSEAIQAAETDSSVDGSTAGSGADVIDFDPNLFLSSDKTIELSGAADFNGAMGRSVFVITTDVTIVGPSGEHGLSLSVEQDIFGARSPDTYSRHFQVLDHASLTLKNLSLWNGRVIGGFGGNGARGGGGGAGLGGSIFNEGTLNLSGVLFLNNFAEGGDGGVAMQGFVAGGGGGGVATSGRSEMTMSGGNGGGPNGSSDPTVQAGVGGGGAGADPSEGNGGNGGFGGGGGGSGSDSSSLGGVGGFGGGGGAGVFDDSAGGFAGGTSDYITGDGGGGAGLGGAIFNNGGAVTVINSTFGFNATVGGSGHFAQNGNALGGAIFSRNGSVVIENSTFSGNHATGGGAVYLLGDGGTAEWGIANSILADSYFGFLGDSSTQTSDIVFDQRAGGSTSSNGHDVGGFAFENAIDVMGMPIGPAPQQGIIQADPQLGDLMDNGGPTPTFMPSYDSPVIGAGLNSLVNQDVTTDGRGFGPRSRHGLDMGAVEVDAAPPYVAPIGQATTFTVSGSGGGTPINIPAGHNRVLVVTTFDDNLVNTNISSVSLGSMNAVQQSSSGADGVRITVWTLALGSSDFVGFGTSLSVEWFGNVTGSVFAQTYCNVNQFLLADHFNSSTSTFDGPSINPGDLAFSAFGVSGDDSVFADPLQTLDYQQTIGSYLNMLVSTKTGADNGNFSYDNVDLGASRAQLVFRLNYEPAPVDLKISSITRYSPTEQRTIDSQVDFLVDFNQAANFDAGDFVLTGTAASSASITSFFAVDSQAFVTVTITGEPDGTLGIGLAETQDITDTSGYAFDGTITSSQTFYIDHAPPSIAVIPRTTAAAHVDLQLTPDENCRIDYVVVPSNYPAMTSAAELRAISPYYSVDLTSGEATTLTLDGLLPDSGYIFYFVGYDAFGYETALTAINFSTTHAETSVTLENGAIVVRDIYTGNSDDSLIIGNDGNYWIINAGSDILTTDIAGALGNDSHTVRVPNDFPNNSSFTTDLGTGHDVITFNNTSSTLLGNVTVLGDSNDEIYINDGLYLDGATLKLQAGTILVQHNLSTTGNGGITLVASDKITVANNKISTEDGDIGIANLLGQGILDSYSGVSISDAVITTSGGRIDIEGAHKSVDVTTDSALSMTNTSITSSKASTDSFSGIYLYGSNESAGYATQISDDCTLSTADGNILIDGYSAGSIGISFAKSVLTITGNGRVALEGTSGASAGISTEASDFTTTVGDISLSGSGQNVGVELVGTGMTSDFGEISASGSAGFNAPGVALFGSNLSSKYGGILLGSFGLSAVTALEMNSKLTTDNSSIRVMAFGPGNSSLNLSGGLLSSNTGNINLTGDSIVYPSISSSGSLTIRTNDSSRSIHVGTGSGGLEIPQSLIDGLGNRFDEVVIGDSNNQFVVVSILATFQTDVRVLGGEIEIDQLFADGRHVELTAATGRIIENMEQTTPPIIAAELLLDAKTGISANDGVGEVPIVTIVESLAARTVSGNIVITNYGDLALDTVGSVSGAVITNEDGTATGSDRIEITAYGELAVYQAVLNNDGGDTILLTNSLPVGDGGLLSPSKVYNGQALQEGSLFGFVTPTKMAQAGDYVYSVLQNETTADSAVIAVSRLVPETGRLQYFGQLSNNFFGNAMTPASNVAVSPDGKSLYVLSQEGSSIAMVPLGSDGIIANFPTVYVDGFGGLMGIDSPTDIVFSPDGTLVFISNAVSGYLTTFTRNTETGELSVQGSMSTSSLNNLTDMSISQDGKLLFLTDPINSTLTILYDADTIEPNVLEVLQDGVSGVDGLGGANQVVVSPDDRFVYATGTTDSAVAIFARDDQSGLYSYVSSIFDDVGSVTQLANPTGIALSPDGTLLYVASETEGVVNVFTRNSQTGALTFSMSAACTDARYLLPSADGRNLVISQPTQNSISAFRVQSANDQATPFINDIGIYADVAGGPVSLLSADDVFFYATIHPTSLTIYAADDEDGSVIQEGGLNLTATSGDIFIASVLSVAMNSLSAADEVRVIVYDGSISEAGDDAVVDITARVTTLDAATGVGTDSASIEVTTDYFAARTIVGDINANFTGATQIDEGSSPKGDFIGVQITSGDGQQSKSDNITLTGNDQISVSNTVNLDGGQTTISAKSIVFYGADFIGGVELSSTDGTTVRNVRTDGNINVTGPLTTDGILVTKPTELGAEVVVIRNDDTDNVAGRFDNLPEGSEVNVDGTTAVLTYFGGDGNDVSLLLLGYEMSVAGTSNDDNFEVRRVLVDDPESASDVDLLQVLNGNVVLSSRPTSVATNVLIDALDGDDSLLANHNASGGFIPKFIYFDGGNGNDSYSTSTFNAGLISNPEDGAYSGQFTIYQSTISGPYSSLNYRNLELITSNVTVGTASFYGSEADISEAMTLSDDANSDLSMSTAGSTSIRFKNPTQQLEINLYGGDDVLTIASLDAAFTGKLIAYGGNGNDTLDASAISYPVQLAGEDGNDTLIGSQAADTISGEAGDDSIVGTNGNDQLVGMTGNDTVTGGEGDDLIAWQDGDGNDSIDGGNGTDHLNFTGADNATQGDDIAIANNAGRVDVVRNAVGLLTGCTLSVGTTEIFDINTLLGDDRIDARNLTLAALNIFSGDGADTIYGGSQDDTLTGNAGNDTIYGGDGIDSLSGGSGADYLDGEAGNDIVLGQGGSLDVVIGGLGNDSLDGGPGIDILMEFGDQNYVLTNSQLTGTVTGTDTLTGVEAAALHGGVSANTMTTTSFTGSVSLYGAEGNDTLTSGNGNDELTGDDGDDVLSSGGGNDRLNGFAGNDVINAGNGNDIARGGAGRDTIDGGDGNDRLFGQGSSFDVLTGGLGNDTINGGTGDDQMNGGDGDDVFVWIDGDGTDVVDGGNGTDRQMVYGSKVLTEGDHITVSDKAGRIALERTAGSKIAAFKLDLGSIERITALLYGGNDLFDASKLTLARVNVAGGFGNDTLLGGSQTDVLSGEAGADLVRGNAGADTLTGGTEADDIDGGSEVDLIDVQDTDAIDTVRNSALDQVFKNVDDVLL